MSATKVTKLSLQSARVGDSVVVSTDGRNAYRYEDGAKWVRLPSDSTYDEKISSEEIRRRLRSWFGHGKLIKHMIQVVFLSEARTWDGPVAGTPITAAEREEIRRNVELALTALGSRVEFA